MGLAPRCLLLGAPGRYPFNGHLRLAVQCGSAHLHLAAAVNTRRDPPAALEAAAVLRAKLAGIDGRDRFGLLRSAWELLAELDCDLLGPDRGEDLALLMVAWDGQGLGVAGTGLEVLYELGDLTTPLLDGAHPLLCIRGVPSTAPGVFTPHRPPLVVVGAAASGALDPSTKPSWELACGLHPGGAS